MGCTPKLFMACGLQETFWRYKWYGCLHTVRFSQAKAVEIMTNVCEVCIQYDSLDLFDNVIALPATVRNNVLFFCTDHKIRSNDVPSGKNIGYSASWKFFIQHGV